MCKLNDSGNILRLQLMPSCLTARVKMATACFSRNLVPRGNTPQKRTISRAPLWQPEISVFSIIFSEDSLIPCLRKLTWQKEELETRNVTGKFVVANVESFQLWGNKNFHHKAKTFARFSCWIQCPLKVCQLPVTKNLSVCILFKYS